LGVATQLKRVTPSPAAVSFKGAVKKRDMHYYQFHIGDYKSHTHHLSLIEDLAFRRLLDHYYLHELPIKQRDIARQIGMKDHEQEVLTVLEEFFLSTEKGYINPRADDEIAKYRKFIEDGKRGAAKRWLKGDDSPPIATPIATINHKPITINQEPIIKEGKPSLSGTTFPPCPHKELLSLWAKHLPHLTQPRSWEGTRQTNMKQRWIQAGKPSAYSPDGYKTTEAGVKWWDSFFGYIANDTSLANGFESQGRTWRPDLEWIVNATNFQKIIDGKYAK
jgi:uncharacterized protein YdaU (DUF1376 family)